MGSNPHTLITGLTAGDTTNQRAVAYCILVIMMMLGVGAMGLMQIILDEKDNEFEHPHEYYVAGTYGSEQVTGSGRSAYINESGNEYMYEFTTMVEGCEIPSFTVICDLSKKPISLYERIGEVTVDDVQCSQYKYAFKGVAYLFDIDEKMVVHQYSVESDDCSLKAKLIG